MAHIHEKIDFTASVYVVYNNKILLHLHKKLGIWLPPGGHIELDEDPEQAARREVKEESGVDVEPVGNPQLSEQPVDGSKDLLPPKYINRHNFNETHEHVDMVYFGRARTDVVTAEEGGEIGWFTKVEVEGGEIKLNDAVKKYALAALKELAV